MIPTNQVRKAFVASLRIAQAMENQAPSIMKPQIERIETHPELATGLQQHISETGAPIRRLEDVLASLNEDPS